jgi:hypothetical protein
LQKAGKSPELTTHAALAKSSGGCAHYRECRWDFDEDWGTLTSQPIQAVGVARVNTRTSVQDHSKFSGVRNYHERKLIPSSQDPKLDRSLQCQFCAPHELIYLSGIRTVRTSKISRWYVSALTSSICLNFRISTIPSQEAESTLSRISPDFPTQTCSYLCVILCTGKTSIGGPICQVGTKFFFVVFPVGLPKSDIACDGHSWAYEIPRNPKLFIHYQQRHA